MPLSQSPLTPKTISGESAKLSFPGSRRRCQSSPGPFTPSLLPQPLHPLAPRVQIQLRAALGSRWPRPRAMRARVATTRAGPRGHRADGGAGEHPTRRPRPAATQNCLARGPRKQMTTSRPSPLNNKASCKASGAVFVVPSAPRGGSGRGEPGAVARGAPLRLIPGKDKEPPSHQLCLDSRPHKSSALFGLALQICQPDQPLKEKGPATPFFPLRCHDCPYVKGSRAGLPAGVTGLVRPVSVPGAPPAAPPTTHRHTLPFLTPKPNPSAARLCPALWR